MIRIASCEPVLINRSLRYASLSTLLHENLKFVNGIVPLLIEAKGKKVFIGMHKNRILIVVNVNSI